LRADVEARKTRFERLVIPLLPQLKAAARALTQTPEGADDLVQDTLLRAWKYDAIAACDGDRRRLLVYLLKILDNCWNAELSRRKAGVGERAARYAVHFRAIVGESAAPEEETESSDLKRQLSGAVARLPRQCRRALVLVARGMSYREAAEIMGVSVSTVPVHVRRAKRLLRKDLEGGGFHLPRRTERAAKEDTP
jgi:RNA polymerase sigma-70 factor (ECF subfamily)